MITFLLFCFFYYEFAICSLALLSSANVRTSFMSVPVPFPWNLDHILVTL
jgi:hypothetical protein